MGRIYSSAFWLISYTVASRVFNLCIFWYLARKFNDITFGEFSLVINTLVLISSFALLGLEVFSNKFLSSDFDNKNKTAENLSLIFIMTMVSVLITVLITFLFAEKISEHFLGNEKYAVLLTTGSFYIILLIINSVLVSILIVFEKVKMMFFMNLFVSIINIPFLIFMTHKFNLVGAIYSQILYYAMLVLFGGSLVIVLLKRSEIKPKLNLNLNKIKEATLFILPISLAGILVTPAKWYANILIIKKDLGIESVGFVTIALQWQSLAILIPGALGPLFLKILSMNVMKNNQIYNQVVKKSIYITALISFGLLAIIIPFINAILVEYNFKSNHVYFFTFLIILSCSLFISLSNNYGKIIASRFSVWWNFYSNALWATVFLVSLTFLIDRFGLIGIGLAYLFSYFIHFLFSKIAVNYLLRTI